MDKNSNFFGQLPWRLRGMDKTATPHRFHNLDTVLKCHFQGRGTASQNREEEGWHQSLRGDTRQRVGSLRRAVHISGHQ